VHFTLLMAHSVQLSLSFFEDEDILSSVDQEAAVLLEPRRLITEGEAMWRELVRSS
jgi:hypothetical protein